MPIPANMKSGRPIVASLIVLFLAGSAFSASHGVEAEARAMLAKAVAHYNSVGRRQALADFTAKKPPFGDRDLYVVCLGPDDTIAADGGFPQIVGARANTLTEIEGKGCATVVRQATLATGEGRVAYLWVNPSDHNLELKTLFLVTVGVDVCGVGIYSKYSREVAHPTPR